MPRLHAKHRTEIRYAGAVGESVNEIRLVPSDNGRQQVEWSHVRVQPGAELMSPPRRVRQRGALVPAHRAARDAGGRGRGDRDHQAGARRATGGGDDAFAGIADPAYRDRYAEFLSGSDRIRWTEPVDLFARALPLDEEEGVLAWASGLEAEVNRAIEYMPGATRVDTPVEEVVRVGRGVCQDMAHLMIAVARRRGVGARYVSGWLNLPGREEPGESHAWVELAIPGRGWMEFDPTHPDPAHEHYVRLAVGRDYADVPPLRGSYLGPATEAMVVTVEVRQLP